MGLTDLQGFMRPIAATMDMHQFDARLPESRLAQPMQLIRAYVVVCLPEYGENHFQSNWKSQKVQLKQSTANAEILEQSRN